MHGKTMHLHISFVPSFLSFCPSSYYSSWHSLLFLVLLLLICLISLVCHKLLHVGIKRAYFGDQLDHLRSHPYSPSNSRTNNTNRRQRPIWIHDSKYPPNDYRNCGQDQKHIIKLKDFIHNLFLLRVHSDNETFFHNINHIGQEHHFCLANITRLPLIELRPLLQ